MKTFKTTLLTIVVLLCSISASAYDFEVNGLYYNLLSASDKTCELAGGSKDITSINIPASVTTRGLSLTVCSIKESAFENNTNLLSVSFVDNPMTSVAANSFKGCTNLTQVELSNTLETIETGAFDGCPISKMVIPSNVKTVGAKGLSNVIEIEIANGNEPISFADSITTLTSAFIGRNVSKSFVANTSISTVTLGTGITEIAPSMFEGCKQIEQISIPTNIVKIGDNAFNGCENLTKLTIEDSDSALILGETIIWTDREVRNNYGYALHVHYNCIHRGALFNVPIKKLYIGRNLTYPSVNVSVRGEYIGETIGGTELINVDGRDYNVKIVLSNYSYSGSPFNGDIESMQFGNKVTQIGDFFFENQKMTSFRVPDSCKLLGKYCFYNCRNLETVDLNNCDKLENRTFIGCEKIQDINWGKTRIVGEYAFSGCSNIASINLSNIDSIYVHAFDGCLGLKKVVIGDNAKEIQQAAFMDCKNLHIVSTGEGISSLPQNCFSGCQTLQWISLGSNLTQIQSGVFSGCSQIMNIEIKSETPPTFENKEELASINKFDATLYIPQSSTPAYEQSDVWKDFLFKQECEIPEYIYSLPKNEENDNSKNVTINGDLTGAIINQINANTVIESLDLQMATLALDNQNAYYKSGKRVDSHWDDVDVVRGAPYYSYAYYTAPTTETYSGKEYNNSGYLINVITNCFSSGLTNAKLNGNLKSIKLPSTLTELGENAIEGTNLTDLYVYSTTPPTATVASFGNTNKTTCVLHVPEGCRTEYESAAGWSSFKKIVESSSDNYIEVQPTNENRQVKLARNDADATYQWYKYVEKTDELVDITNILSATSGWENTDNGWESNMHEATSSAVLSYECTFNTGDELSFDWVVSCEEIFDQLQVYFDDELLLVKSGEISGSFSKTFEKPITGNLCFCYVKDNAIDFANDNVQIRNVKVSSTVEQTMEIPEAIEGEINRELNMKSVSYDGDKVFCIVTLGNGKRLRTNDFICEYQNFIKTQPTIDNLQVELNTSEEGVRYQWYQYVEGMIYSKEIVPTSSGPFAWTESNGIWTSGNNIEGSQTFSVMTATVKVQLGDTISFDYTVPKGDGSYSGGSQWFQFTLKGETNMQTFGGKNGHANHFELHINNYIIDRKLNEDSTMTVGFECVRTNSERATVSNIKHTRPTGFYRRMVDEEIVGATTARLDESLFNKGNIVYCVVTLPNGTTIISDEVQTTIDGTKIEEVVSNTTNGYIVYNLYGTLVMRTMDKSDLNNLPQGIYIINNKKMFVK